MKRMVCELCGSSSFVKTGGMYVCQGCGCAFTVEDARTLLCDVEDPKSEKCSVSVSNDSTSDHDEEIPILMDIKRNLKIGLWKDAFQLLKTLSMIDSANPYVSVFPHICQGAIQGELSEISSAGAAFENVKNSAYDRWGVSDELEEFCKIFSSSMAKAFPVVAESMVESLINCREKAQSVHGFFARSNAIATYTEVADKTYNVICRIGELLIKSIINVALPLHIEAAIAGDLEAIYQYINCIDERCISQNKYDFSSIKKDLMSITHI